MREIIFIPIIYLVAINLTYAQSDVVYCSDADNQQGYGEVVEIEGEWYRRLSESNDEKCVSVVQVPFFVRNLTNPSNIVTYQDLFANKLRSIHQLFPNELAVLTLMHMNSGFFAEGEFARLITDIASTPVNTPPQENVQVPFAASNFSANGLSGNGAGATSFGANPYFNIGLEKWAENIWKKAGEGYTTSKDWINGSWVSAKKFTDKQIVRAKAVPKALDLVAQVDSEGVVSAVDFFSLVDTALTEEEKQQLVQDLGFYAENRELILGAILSNEMIGMTLNAFQFVSTIDELINGDPVLNKLEEIQEQIVQINHRLDNINERFDSMISRIDEMQSTLIYEHHLSAYEEDYTTAASLINEFNSPGVQSKPFFFVTNKNLVLNDITNQLNLSAAKVLASFYEINSPIIEKPSDIKWFGLNHNILQGQFDEEDLSRKVTHVIDKHPLELCWTIESAQTGNCSPSSFAKTTVSTYDLALISQLIMLKFRFNEILYQNGYYENRQNFLDDNSYFAKIYQRDIVLPLIERLENNVPLIESALANQNESYTPYLDILEYNSIETTREEKHYLEVAHIVENGLYEVANGSVTRAVSGSQTAIDLISAETNAQVLRHSLQKNHRTALQQSAMLASLYLFLDANIYFQPWECEQGTTWRDGVCEMDSCIAENGDIYAFGTQWREELTNGYRQLECAIDENNLVFIEDNGISCDIGYIWNNGACEEQLCLSTDGDQYTVGESWVDISENRYQEYTCVRNSTGWVNANPGNWGCVAGYVLKQGLCVEHRCQGSNGNQYSVGEMWEEKDGALNSHLSCETNEEGWAYRKLNTQYCDVGFIWQDGGCHEQMCVGGDGEVYPFGATWEDAFPNGRLAQECVRSTQGWLYTKSETICNVGYIYDNGGCTPQMCESSDGVKYDVGESWTDRTLTGFQEYTCIRNGSGWVNANPGNWGCNVGYVLERGVCVEHQCAGVDGERYFEGERWVELDEGVERHVECRRNAEGWVYRAQL